jgi:hypothetical protein
MTEKNQKIYLITLSFNLTESIAHTSPKKFGRKQSLLNCNLFANNPAYDFNRQQQDSWRH